ncbi:MAG: hypothetical protein PWP60_956, partial [Candidatus Atribacteria bacterium]|nr:hypothetical protein [Candidatus Atribacteria bacterium]
FTQFIVQSHTVGPEVPVENIVAFIESCQRFSFS